MLREKKDHNTLIFIGLVFVLIVLPLTYSKSFFEVETDEPKVYYVKSSFWGLSKWQTEIRWMRAPGYDYDAWCAKGKTGKWYPLLLDNDQP